MVMLGKDKNINAKVVERDNDWKVQVTMYIPKDYKESVCVDTDKTKDYKTWSVCSSGRYGTYIEDESLGELSGVVNLNCGISLKKEPLQNKWKAEEIARLKEENERLRKAKMLENQEEQMAQIKAEAKKEAMKELMQDPEMLAQLKELLK